MSPEQPYRYSADDLRRYKQGLMSHEEMHAMEKAALDDPFLADAMEGFEQTSTPVVAQDLDQLKDRLTQRVRPETSAARRPKQWLSMAAGVVLVLGAAIASWYIFQPKAEQQIAQTTETQVSPPAPAPVIPAQDSTPSIAAADEAAPPLASVTKKPKLQASEPAPQAKDSVMQDLVASNEASKLAEKIEPTVDRLDRSKTKDEVAYKKISREAPTQAPMATNAKKEESPARIYAEPGDGWAAFEVYLKTALKRPTDPVLHGNVVVSFSVNPENGKLYDFHIDKPLQPLYDKEAIRVLKEGPPWAVYNTEGAVKTSYTVVF